MSTELKPCPFCGATTVRALSVDEVCAYAVVCAGDATTDGCGARGPVSYDRNSAATLWNKQEVVLATREQCAKLAGEWHAVEALEIAAAIRGLR